MDFIYIEMVEEVKPEPEPQPTFKPEQIDCSGLIVLPFYLIGMVFKLLNCLIKAMVLIVVSIPNIFQETVDFVTPILYPQDFEEKKHGPDSSTSLWKGL
jgi:hypothetical protein